MSNGDSKVRCWGDTEDLMREYHDLEWGVPVHDDIEHFELIILEGAQAGLSWRTILQRRENYRKAFQGFNPATVAGYTPEKLQDIKANSGIIRNQLKIESAVRNAKAFLKVQEEFGSFDNHIWRFVNHKPITNHYTSFTDVPAKTEISEAMSKDLKKRGFNFVGPTICYAYMQTAGMVNDHLATCFRWKEINDLYGE